jgi:hypothetical protein
MDAFSVNARLFKKYVETTWSYGPPERGRCYLAYSGHSYFDTHYQAAWPPVYYHEGHWRTGALLRQIICRL